MRVYLAGVLHVVDGKIPQPGVDVPPVWGFESGVSMFRV